MLDFRWCYENGEITCHFLNWNWYKWVVPLQDDLSVRTKKNKCWDMAEVMMMLVHTGRAISTVSGCRIIPCVEISFLSRNEVSPNYWKLNRKTNFCLLLSPANITFFYTLKIWNRTKNKEKCGSTQFIIEVVEYKSYQKQSMVNDLNNNDVACSEIFS